MVKAKITLIEEWVQESYAELMLFSCEWWLKSDGLPGCFFFSVRVCACACVYVCVCVFSHAWSSVSQNPYTTNKSKTEVHYFHVISTRLLYTISKHQERALQTFSTYQQKKNWDTISTQKIWSIQCLYLKRFGIHNSYTGNLECLHLKKFGIHNSYTGNFECLQLKR